MGKAKMLGMNNHPKERKRELRFERQNARQEVKRHNPWLSTVCGGVDSGCLKASVVARKKR